MGRSKRHSILRQQHVECCVTLSKSALVSTGLDLCHIVVVRSSQKLVTMQTLYCLKLLSDNYRGTVPCFECTNWAVFCSVNPLSD